MVAVTQNEKDRGPEGLSSLLQVCGVSGRGRARVIEPRDASYRCWSHRINAISLHRLKSAGLPIPRTHHDGDCEREHSAHDMSTQSVLVACSLRQGTRSERDMARSDVPDPLLVGTDAVEAFKVGPPGWSYASSPVGGITGAEHRRAEI